MSNLIWILVAAVALLVVIWRVLAPSLDRGVNRALRDRSTEQLVQAILSMGRAAQPDAFNHAIRRLWDAYERPLTIPLIKTLVEHHEESQIAQYWLDQVQGVEPELAREAIVRFGLLGFLLAATQHHEYPCPGKRRDQDKQQRKPNSDASRASLKRQDHHSPYQEQANCANKHQNTNCARHSSSHALGAAKRNG